MIKMLVVFLVAVSLGYTYGFRQADAGQESLIDAGLQVLGIHRAVHQLDSEVRQMNREEAARQHLIDSIKQARLDSIAPPLHH